MAKKSRWIIIYKKVESFEFGWRWRAGLTEAEDPLRAHGFAIGSTKQEARDKLLLTIHRSLMESYQYKAHILQEAAKLEVPK